MSCDFVMWWFENELYALFAFILIYIPDWLSLILFCFVYLFIFVV